MHPPVALHMELIHPAGNLRSGQQPVTRSPGNVRSRCCAST